MKLEALKELAAKVEAVEDAYSRWLVTRCFRGIDWDNRIKETSNALHGALADLFDNGPEPDEEPCALKQLLSTSMTRAQDTTGGMSEKNCRKCVHVGLVEGGIMLVCRWEQSFLPPPVCRKRCWGTDAPQTHEGWAKDCQHFQAQDTTGENAT